MTPGPTYLDALALAAGQRRLHLAVVLAQRPVPVNQRQVGPAHQGGGAWRLLPRGAGRPLGVEDVEHHVALTHVKVPGDDRGHLSDVDEQLGGGEDRRQVLTLRAVTPGAG